MSLGTETGQTRTRSELRRDGNEIKIKIIGGIKVKKK